MLGVIVIVDVFYVYVDIFVLFCDPLITVENLLDPKFIMFSLIYWKLTYVPT